VQQEGGDGVPCRRFTTRFRQYEADLHAHTYLKGEQRRLLGLLQPALLHLL
jgi:hypothetical protein